MNESNDAVEQLHWRLLHPDEAELAYLLHLEAIADQPPGAVRPDNITHFVGHTNDAGQILACFTTQQELVAYGVLGLRSPTVQHMAELLDVPDHARSRFAILDGVAALTSWRGRGLHRDSILVRLEHASSNGRSLIGATVAPGNIASLRGLLDANFHIKKFSMLYGGLPRLVLQNDLLAPKKNWILHARVNVIDQDAHLSALSNGWFGYGYETEDRHQCCVLYGVRS